LIEGRGGEGKGRGEIVVSENRCLAMVYVCMKCGQKLLSKNLYLHTHMRNANTINTPDFVGSEGIHNSMSLIYIYYEQKYKVST
jgi:hypothetical protein